MTAVLREHLTKACVLLLLVALGVCTLTVLPMSDSDSAVRSRFIPRYLFEKEIRGPDYHVVKHIFENDGFTSVVKARRIAGQTASFNKVLLRSRRALQEQEDSPLIHRMRRGMRVAPAHPKPYIST